MISWIKNFLRLMLSTCLVLAVPFEQIWATPWQIEPGLVPTGTERGLRENRSDLGSGVDLMLLLETIGRKAQFDRLVANPDGSGVIRIEGTLAKIVTEIDVVGAFRDIRGQLRILAQNLEGQVDTPELGLKLKKDFNQYLSLRGYRQASVAIERKELSEKNGGSVSYMVKVSEGSPCIIDRVDMGIRLPVGIRSGITVGGICDEEAIRRAADDLLEEIRAAGYNQARVELAGLSFHPRQNTATVHIGGILGKRIRYQVNDRSSMFRIDDLFAADELSGIDPTIVGPDAMAAELTRRYRARGYSDVAVVGPTQQRPSADEIVYVYDVDPGVQYTLRSVNFEGNSRFSYSELIGMMNLKGFWQNTAAPLDPELIRAGVEAVKFRYQSDGFWDVIVRDRPPSRDRETGDAQVTISITEGPQRILGAIKVEGAKNFNSADLIRLPDDNGFLERGYPLDRSVLYRLQQSIRSRYFEAGYLYAEIQVDMAFRRERKNIVVDVVVEVFEGVRVKIGNISIAGLSRTKPKVVLRELQFEKGEWYNPAKITESRRSLVALGLFRSVQIVPLDRNALADEDAELDLLVDVREGKAGSVAFGPGWSLADGYRFNTEATYSNIGGLGRQVSVRAGFNQELRQVAIGNKTLVGRSIGAGYVEPYIFDWPLDFTVSASNQARSTESAWEFSRVAEVALTRKLRWLGPNSYASIYYGQKFTTQETDAAQDFALLSDDVRVGFVGVRGNIDKRNDPTWPTDGYTLMPEVALAGFNLGGDLRYVRTDLSYARYFGFGSRFVLAVGSSISTYQNVARVGSDRSLDLLPPSERLYVGGADTVRGFRERSLGPVIVSPNVDSDGLWDCSSVSSRSGGSRRVVFKFEGRYRISDTLATTAFLDNGNVFFSQEEADRFSRVFSNPVDIEPNSTGCGGVTPLRSLRDNNGYNLDQAASKPSRLWSRHYSSVGSSINFLTAIGSVNLAYGIPVHEPVSAECNADESYCYPRGKQKGFWFTRGEFHLNVGARF